MSSRSIVSLQLGQCGNQVATQFFHTLAKELTTTPEREKDVVVPGGGKADKEKVGSKASADRLWRHSVDHFHAQFQDKFFRTAELSNSSSLIPRSILIDMEPKVIEDSLHYAEKTGLFHFPVENSYSRQSGSANNWAFGYYGHGKQNHQEMMNKIRKEIEHTDSLAGFLLFQSLAGGTGSGLGTYLTEQIHEEFPQKSLLNHVILPYSMGEVITQSYNTLFSLCHLNSSSSGLILVENDIISQICTRLLGEIRPSFKEINRIIGENLTNILLPGYITDSGPALSPGNSKEGDDEGKQQRKIEKPQHSLGHPLYCPYESGISHLFSHSSYKISTIRTIPYSSEYSKPFQSLQWNYLIKYGRQMIFTNKEMEDRINWRISLPEMKCPGRISNEQQNGQAAVGSSIPSHQQLMNSALSSGISYQEASLQAGLSLPMPKEEYFYHFDHPSSPYPNGFYHENYHQLQSLYQENHSYRQQQEEEKKSNNGGGKNNHSSATAAAEALFENESTRSIATIAYLRGHSAYSADLRSLDHPYLYGNFSWNPFLSVRNHIPIHQETRKACFWSNNNGFLRPLERINEKAQKMYGAGAYLHHYQKYGMEKEEFQENFLEIEQILSDYRKL